MNGLTLPPLILHPFADSGGPDKLVESSRANLMIQGLLPSGERSSDDLDRALLDGRFCEIRMLYYVGKDLTRWIEQCLEHLERNAEMRDRGIRFQSFAAYLVEHTPEPVQTKLKKWGVADYKAIFSRALGLCVLLGSAPLPIRFRRNSSATTIATPITSLKFASRKWNSPISPPSAWNSRSLRRASIRACWSANGRKAEPVRFLTSF